MIRLLAILLLVVACSCTNKPKQVTNYSPPTETVNCEDQDFLARFEWVNDSMMQRVGSPGAAIVVVKDNEVKLLKTYGVRKLGEPALVDKNTVFRLGSLSKGFAGVLTALLIEHNLFSWDDPVTKYLPQFKLKDSTLSDSVLVRHLLSHTTGMQKHAYTNLIEDGMPISEIIPKIPEVNLISKPGGLFAYQNLGISLVQEIIKKQTDTTYGYWLENQLLKPLGMEDYSLTHKQFMENPNIAYPHRHRTKTRFKAIKPNRKYYNSLASGGVNVSIRDMGLWLKFLLNNQPNILDSNSFEYVFTPVALTSGVHGFDRWEGVQDSYYAIGWRILDYNGNKIIYHGGSVSEYRSEIMIDQKNGWGICALFNGQCRYASKVIPTFLRELNAGN